MSVKVCHVTSVHSRYDIRIFLKECTSLANEGYDTILLVADGISDEVKNGVRIVSVPKISKSRFLRIIMSSNIMYKKAMEIRADIYHLHDPELLPLARKLKRAGRKVIFDSHENYEADIKVKNYIPYIFRAVIAIFYKRYETKTVKMLDAVIAPCTFRGGVDMFKDKCPKTEIISNVPLLSEFYDKYEDIDKEYNLPAICYIGGLTHNRGVTHLVSAAYKANVKLILGGKFSPTVYEDEIKKMSEYSCVEYRGHLTREQVLEVYKESKIGVATVLNIGHYNTGDSFATKVYEYMSMGLPVIITKTSHTEKTVSKYGFGLAVDPENIEEIVNAINFLISNPEKAKKMGENGRRAVLEEFNWQIEEKKLLALYSELANI